MAEQAQLAARIDRRLKEAVQEHCEAHGLKMNRFIADALLDKLEELDDIEDIKKIRFERTRPLGEVIADLGLDGDL